MVEFLNKYRQYFRLTDLDALCQRYFVIGAFDGALTALGMIFASYFSGSLTPDFILPAALGATVALGLSSAWGAYEAERVMQRQELERLEKAIIRNMDNTVHEKAAHFAVLFGAFVHGIAPVPAALLPILPFIWVPAISIDTAFIISVGLTFTFLFFLGIFLARIGKMNKAIMGGRMILAGLVTAIFCLVIGAAH